MDIIIIHNRNHVMSTGNDELDVVVVPVIMELWADTSYV